VFFFFYLRNMIIRQNQLIFMVFSVFGMRYMKL